MGPRPPPLRLEATISLLDGDAVQHALGVHSKKRTSTKDEEGVSGKAGLRISCVRRGRRGTLLSGRFWPLGARCAFRARRSESHKRDLFSMLGFAAVEDFHSDLTSRVRC